MTAYVPIPHYPSSTNRQTGSQDNFSEETATFAYQNSIANIPDPDQITRKSENEKALHDGQNVDGYAGKKGKRSEGYKPYTLQEYNSKVKNQSYKYGGLGANTHTEDWKEKKGKAMKVNAFSEVIKEANANKISTAPPSKRPEPLKKPSTREKAMEFAKNIPKPKANPQQKETNQVPRKHPNERRQPETKPMTPEELELEMLEKKHEFFLQKINKKESQNYTWSL